MPLSQSQKIGFAGLFMFIFSFLLQFLIVPPIVKLQVKKKVALKKGWPMRDIWSKLPFVLESRMYIFNVTNPMEIGNGAKPIIREIGPFVYDMYQEKTLQIDHDDDDTVSYVMKNTYHFNRIKSEGLSDEVEVYFPHTYIMTAANGFFKSRPPMVTFTSKGVDSILKNPDSLFFKVKARILLFDGFAIPCHGIDDFFGKLSCNTLHDEWFNFTVRKRGDTYYTSLFGFMNGTYEKQKRIRINRGIESLQDLGKIVRIDDKDNINTWNDDNCNAFRGTDGTAFPPFIDVKTKSDVMVVQSSLCRQLNLTFESEVQFSGLNLLRYTGNLGTDGNHVPKEKCYCYTPDTCLLKGMFDLINCHNVPAIASNPHFYLADPYYLTRIDTLKPDKDKHQTYVDLDPLTGQPVRVHLRVQLNMELLNIPQFLYMRNYTYAMLPMVWFDESLLLPDFYIDQIKFAYLQIKLSKIMEYAMMIGGLAMCALTAYRYYESRKVTTAVLDFKADDDDEINNNVSAISSEIASSV